MTRQELRRRGADRRLPATATVIALAWAVGGATPVRAWSTVDGTLEVHGFVDSTTHQRMHGLGLSKQRFRGQLEFSKNFGAVGIFSELSTHGILRAAYDGVYDLNSDDYGDEAGGAVSAASTGIPTPAGPLATPWGMSPVTAGNPALPGGGGFGFDTTANPNIGLRKVGRARTRRQQQHGPVRRWARPLRAGAAVQRRSPGLHRRLPRFRRRRPALPRVPRRPSLAARDVRRRDGTLRQWR